MKRIVPLLALMATACAPVTKAPTISDSQAQAEADRQMTEAVRRVMAANEHVANVYRPVRLANVELCGEKVRRNIGAGLMAGPFITRQQLPTYAKLYNSTDSNTVITYVLKGGPAERAGLQVGDIVRATKGMTHGELLNIGDPSGKTGPVTLSVTRAGETRDVELQPDLGCDYPVQVVAQDAVNAYADGKKIVVTTGLVNFVRSDDELALVLGHELAHNSMDHIGKKKGNEFVGVLLGATLGVLSGGYATGSIMDSAAAAGRGAFSQEFESEADYVGVYHAARAGYQVASAADLWRRMGEAHPASIHLEGTSHPSTAKRFLAIEAAAAEVEVKRAAGAPLVPDRREN